MAISNVVALKRVVADHENAPLREVVNAINIKLRLADQNDNDARNHRAEAGEMLTALRKRVEDDGNEWWQFAKGHFDRARKELEKLMNYVPAHKVAKAAIQAHPEKSDRAIAAETGVGKDTVRRARQTTGANAPVGKRVGKDGRARQLPKLVKVDAKRSYAPDHDADHDDDNIDTRPATAAEKATSFLIFSNEAMLMAKYDGPINDQVLDAAKAAASAWNGVVEEIEKRRNPRKRRKIDPVAIRQVSAFHTELQNQCQKIEAWLATKPPLCDEAVRCLYNGLETASMRLGRLAMELDGR
jgi:hypothetical protein